MSVSGFKFVMFTQPFHHKDPKARRKKKINRRDAETQRKILFNPQIARRAADFSSIGANLRYLRDKKFCDSASRRLIFGRIPPDPVAFVIVQIFTGGNFISMFY